MLELRNHHPELDAAAAAQGRPGEWYTMAFAGDTLCWRRGETIAIGDSVARSVRVLIADGGLEYELGRYDLREPAVRFDRQPLRGHLCVKLLAEFPAGTRPGPLRIVPASRYPHSAR